MAKSNPLTQALKGSIKGKAKKAAPAPDSNGNGSKAPVAPSRVGRVIIGGHFLPEVQLQLKLIAVTERTTVQALVAEALDLLFQARQKPQIAAAKAGE